MKQKTPLFIAALAASLCFSALCCVEDDDDETVDSGAGADTATDEDAGGAEDAGSDADTGLETNGCTPEDLVSAVSQDNILSTLEVLTALNERKTFAGQQKALSLLEERLNDFGVIHTPHSYEWNNHTWTNIEVTLPGNVLTDEVYIAGGHYDSTSLFGAAPGADDNGSGTAALVELARVLRDCEYKRTVKLVFFSNEEQGLIGSERYAADAVENEMNIQGFLALDTIGFGPADEDLNVNTKTGMDWLANAVKDASDLHVGLPVVVEVDDQCG